jgi:hypothetical protein
MMEEQGDKKEKKEKRPSPKSPPMEKAERGVSGRILGSASALLRDSFSLTSTQSASTLSNVLPSEGKAGSSTASASTNPGTASELYVSLKDGQGLESRPNAASSFREPSRVHGTIHSRSSDIAGGLSLDQFMGRAEDGSKVPTWQHSPTAKGKQLASGPKGYHAERQASDLEMSATWDTITHN